MVQGKVIALDSTWVGRKGQTGLWVRGCHDGASRGVQYLSIYTRKHKLNTPMGLYIRHFRSGYYVRGALARPSPCCFACPLYFKTQLQAVYSSRQKNSKSIQHFPSCH